VAALVRLTGDIALAEEAVQDAFTTALERWPADGVPPSPAGWIITTARNRAIDRLRREHTRDERHEESARLMARDESIEDTAEDLAMLDDRIIDRLDLDGYYLLHATRAEMLSRLGLDAEAAREYEQAITLTQNEVERAFLRGRLRHRPTRRITSRSANAV
jgi:predicted RNA polymerase sigma factor